MIEVDGSLMEGGGQLLRMATTYSAILGEPVKITHIRAKRTEPGLKPQHLTTLKAVSEICGARTEGLSIGSMDVEFYPGEIRGGNYEFDIGTAGSISLLLQCSAPVAAFANSPIGIKAIGGTAVRWSPPMPLVENVVWKGLKQMGFKGDLSTLREGFHPKGGGSVEARINPIRGFSPLQGERSKIHLIEGVSYCGGLPKHVAERQASSAEKTMLDSGIRSDISVKIPNPDSIPFSPGSYICLWAVGDALIGDDALGERGKQAEKVGAEAAGRMINQFKTSAYVDLHTADNLILPCSLADGESKFTVSRITMHTLTAVDIAQKITGAKISVEGTENKPGRISCKGIGIKNKNFL